MTYAHPDSLVSTEWLAAHLDDPAVAIADASFTMPGVTPTAAQDYARRHIPGAIFFDIDDISDRANPLPHMLPSPEAFARRVGQLGLGDEQRIVIYDAAGTAAPRAWWMFRVFGHEAVSLLDGGLRKWLAEGRQVTTVVPQPRERRFTPRFDRALMRDRAAMLANVASRREQVADARTAGRFSGSDAEPRPGLRAGHIPGSVNLPWQKLCEPKLGTMLPREQLDAQLRAAGLVPERPIVASCGSGVSACNIAFALHLAGWPSAAVYDGSWSEWGLPGDTPVATGPA